MRKFYNKNLILSFSEVQKNEEKTFLIQKEKREDDKFNLYDNRISYMTDLHLLHKLKKLSIHNAKKNITNYLVKIVNLLIDDINKTYPNFLLLGGDISSDFQLFCMFIDIFSKKIDKEIIKPKTVFVLGNHELWDFPNTKLNKIIATYKKLLKKYNIYFLQNDLLLQDINNKIKILSYNKLKAFDSETLSNIFRNAKLTILGGQGFSGYNENLNANNGIYLKVLSRKEEIIETKKFEEVYNKLLPFMVNHNGVVLTHMPKDCWHANPNYDENILYINGHTHKNFFNDDGQYRVYADNQIGYDNTLMHLKTLYIKTEYDYFVDYNDGIYNISAQNYKDYYRAKNDNCTFNHKFKKMYMLKKEKYYAFIIQNKKDELLMLNKGNRKKLHNNDIDYYYKYMLSMINASKKPLDKYTKFQNEISKNIKNLGGTGIIHGSIIDIDALNHIYVGLKDNKIFYLPYYAENIIYKVFYPNIPHLLKEKCPKIYNKWSNSDKYEILNKNFNLINNPTSHENTEMYKASKEIRKMQRLYNNTLTFWDDKYLISNNKKLDNVINI